MVCRPPAAVSVTREPVGQPASGGTSNGADRSRREREGTVGTAAITAEVHYSLVTTHRLACRPVGVDLRERLR